MNNESELAIQEEIQSLNAERLEYSEKIRNIDKQLYVAKTHLLEVRTGFKGGNKVITPAGEIGILTFSIKYPLWWCWRVLNKTGKISSTIRVLSGNFEKYED